MTAKTPPGDAPDRWYEDGLAFECTACGKCCRDHGEYAFVYVSSRDLTALLAETGLDEATFLERYCAEDDGWTVLKRNGDACIFLDDKGHCGVYRARPKQCATWPFWLDNLESRRVWEGPVKDCCPGIDQGPKRSADEALSIALENEAWYDED